MSISWAFVNALPVYVFIYIVSKMISILRLVAIEYILYVNIASKYY